MTVWLPGNLSKEKHGRCSLSEVTVTSPWRYRKYFSELDE